MPIGLNQIRTPVASFPYGWDGRPYADIYLQGARGQWVKVKALADSGNDITLVTLDVGRQLGLDPRNGRRFEVIGIAPTPMVFHMFEIPLRIGNFQPIVTTVGVGNIPQNLLGREDIFQKFDITFTAEGRTIFTCNRCSNVT